MEFSKLFGFNKPSRPEIICGGVTDNTDNGAPKEIASDELVSFSTKFFAYGKYGSDVSGTFWFEAKPDENGRLFLSEKLAFNNTGCVTDAEFLPQIQKVIAKYDLAKLNGVERYTNGLPPEYQPAFLSAEYASGERLYFCVNNSPHEGWSADIFALIADEFAKSGDRRFLPPEEANEITRFDLEFTDGEIKYNYGELSLMKEGVAYTFEEIAEGNTDKNDFFTVIQKRPYLRSGEDAFDYSYVYNIPGEDYYKGLIEAVGKAGLRDLANGRGYPSPFDYEGTPQYYYFYAEFADGGRTSGFSDIKEDYDRIMPALREISGYIDSFIDKDPHKVKM